MKHFSFEITSRSPLRVRSSTGEQKFTGLVAKECSKVYVVSAGRNIVYVGSSKQPIRTRLDGALKANGANGYYGYAWKTSSDRLNLDVWVLEEVEVKKGRRCIIAETVEAEIVFLIRLREGNWPKHQTEIHFHPSSKQHRRWAEEIYEEIRKRA
jgi:hypothetical protein